MTMLPMETDLGAQPLPFLQGPQLQAANIPQLKGRGGMFGAGGVGRNIAGLIGDFLMARAGMQPMYAPMMMQRQQLAQRAALEEKQHQQQMQDQIALYDYRSAHPAPPNNDTVNDYQFIAQQLGPDAAKKYLESKTNPIIMTPYGPMSYSSVSGAQAPTTPVGKLTPIDDGGPTPPASGGFPY